MSDNKRVVLTTLETQKVGEVVKKHCKIVRICVALPESNEDKCPEYNYKDELAAAKKKQKLNGKDSKESNHLPNGLDPFDNDDDVRRIALEMEAKYGTGVNDKSKKKRKVRKDDYADIGAGYDESDSFIDNTDGYDEIIPHNVTTARGGFYINSGALEFKTDDEATSDVSSDSSGESSESEESESKSKRKRALDTTDEEDAASDNDSSKQQDETKKEESEVPNISMHQAIKKKLFSPDKIQIKKRRLVDPQKKLEKDLIIRENKTDNSDNTEKDSLKENKKPMRLSSVQAAIESVISRSDPLQNPPVLDLINKESSPNKIVELEPPTLEIETVQPVEIVKLSENIPAEILIIIERIKTAARNYKDGGKVKFFSGEINVMLLNLERKCKTLGRSSRVRVYEHLAPFVRCRKETLVKRAKNLVIEDEQKRLKKTIENMKRHIDQLMPSLMSNYEKECQRVLQKKFSQEAVENEQLKNLKAPRRRFPLSEDIKRMIRDIVTFKKRSLLHEGKRKDSLETLLAEYLKQELLVLWPEGWMSMNVLKKFCTMAAIKTPDPKAAANINLKHSQKSHVSSTSSLTVNSSTNNLTITSVNLKDRLNDAGNYPSSKPDKIIKPVIKERPVETIIKPISKEKLEMSKDNGVIVINTSKTKENSVIPKSTHCQVIDLTDPPTKTNPVDEIPRPFPKARETSKTNLNFESALKNKLPDISVSATNNFNDKDDVQKVMESLKALQKLSSPSKNESAASSSVSVIAYNKNYSNSGSSQNNSGVANERTNFSGIGFQDEYQKQFIGSLSNPPPSSKSGYNRCS